AAAGLGGIAVCALLLGACGGGGSGGAGGGGGGASNVPSVPSQTMLLGSAIPQFENPLPTLSVAGGTMPTITGNKPLTIRMCEFWASVLPPRTFTTGAQPKT